MEIVLSLYLTLMVTNSSGERSFSCLKRIKSDLRTSMGEHRLSSMALMSMEVDKLREIDSKDTLIDEFIVMKSRRRLFKSF